MTHQKGEWRFSKISLKPLDASLRWHDKNVSTAVFRMNRASSFDKTIEGAIANLKKAVELYLEDEKSPSTYHCLKALAGKPAINR